MNKINMKDRTIERNGVSVFRSIMTKMRVNCLSLVSYLTINLFRLFLYIDVTAYAFVFSLSSIENRSITIFKLNRFS